MTYRHIEDGKIIGGPQALPTNWRDKGDLSGWPEKDLAAEGWVPNVVVDNRKPGEIDAGWTDALEDGRVVQTLLSQPVTQESVDAAKVAAWESIKAERDRRRTSGIKSGAYWFRSDDRAVGEYNSIINLAAKSGLPDSYVIRPKWRTLGDGVTVDMTAGLAGQILMSGFQSLAAIDDAATAHRAAMLASADPAVYDFSSGWPATFGG